MGCPSDSGSEGEESGTTGSDETDASTASSSASMTSAGATTEDDSTTGTGPVPGTSTGEPSTGDQDTGADSSTSSSTGVDEGACGRGGLAFPDEDEGLFPEGVAIAPDGDIYGTTLSLALDRGQVFRFPAGEEPGEELVVDFGEFPALALFTGGVVSELDGSEVLWVCNSSLFAPGEDAQIVAIDTDTGEVRAAHGMSGAPGPMGVEFCNDLIVDAAGNIYATDSGAPRVLRLDASLVGELDGDAPFEMEVVLDGASVEGVDGALDGFGSLNGIAYDESTDSVYVLGVDGSDPATMPVNNGRIVGFSSSAADDGAELPSEALTVIDGEFDAGDGLELIDSSTFVVAQNDGFPEIEAGGTLVIVSADGTTTPLDPPMDPLDGAATFILDGRRALVVESQAFSVGNPDRPVVTPFCLRDYELGR